MYNKIRPLAAGLVALVVIALVPLGLQGTNQKSEPQPLNSWVDYSQTQCGIVARQMGRMPLTFTENRGQWDEHALFQADAGSATMWFTNEGTYYQFTRKIPHTESSAEDSGAPQLTVGLPDRGRYGRRQMSFSAPSDRFNHEPHGIETIAIKATFVGANPNPEIIGEGLMEHRCNYFIGNDPADWHIDVPNYRAICLKEIYSGINLRYYGNDRQLEYDFIISPGADPSIITIQYEGALSLSVNSGGELVVATEWGEAIEQCPVVYQVQNGVRKSISGEYLLAGDNAFGFALGKDFNPALPLVIDPVLSYSTYLGGSNNDRGYGIAVDGSGNAYVTGETYSTGFPTANPYQAGFGGGSTDAFVTKLNSAGDGLIYSTYLGGSGTDRGLGIAVDNGGNAYVAGYTTSIDFPTQNPYQTNRPDIDVIVAKLNDAGNGLVYSTYLGGDYWEYGLAITVDGDNNAYVTGYTFSTDFPIVEYYQAHQYVEDVFVTKFNSAGNGLWYSTYLGGSDVDIGHAIAVDLSGNAYITGETYSTDFPSQNPYQGNQNDYDAFVTKLNSAGNELVYSTYLGGNADDYGRGIAVDGAGNAYITGDTYSTDFPTQNPYQTDQLGSDAFVTKLNNAGNGLIYSTYLGGNDYDYGRGIAVDGSGSAYLTGHTYSMTFPIEDPNQLNQPGIDGFVTRFNSVGNGLVYSTYLGGSDADHGKAIAIDGAGNAYVTGMTGSSDFPTQNPYQADLLLIDAFVTKLVEYVCECGGKGDVDGSGGVPTPLDVTYLVQRVYKSQDALHDYTATCPYENGDVDCSDGPPNPLDVTCLVQLVYKSQDALCGRCGE